MTGVQETLLAAALRLSETDRLTLALQLLETVPGEISLWSGEEPEFLEQLQLRVEGSPEQVPLLH